MAEWQATHPFDDVYGALLAYGPSSGFLPVGEHWMSFPVQYQAVL